mmetsp:Transcript_29125/g.35979  ORF Transcript_29125/g.35979 Transcript_29125/m.35979 type:complete len:349 (+) Transcript_29125:596-1642(+)
MMQSLYRLDLNNNQLTTLPSEIAIMSRLRDLRLGNNQLTTLPSEIGMMSLNALQLGTNPVVCGYDFLSWYPEPRFAGIVGDKAEVICANVNVYGELGLNPHILRVDGESPKSYATHLPDELITSTDIKFYWRYSMLKEPNVLDFSFIRQFSTYSYPPNYYTNGTNGTREYGNFRNCQSFLKPEINIAKNKLFFGFEIRWSSGMRRCYLANEVALDNSTFSYTITNLVPSTEYNIRIRPFHVYFNQNEETAKIVFGISSTTRTVKTESGTPVYAPANITFESVNARDITMTWDEISQEGVTGYEVRVFTDSDKSAGTLPSVRTSISVSKVLITGVHGPLRLLLRLALKT